MSSKKSSTSSSRRKRSLAEMTETLMSIEEDIEQLTSTPYDTSKTGLMRQREWQRQPFKPRPMGRSVKKIGRNFPSWWANRDK